MHARQLKIVSQIDAFMILATKNKVAFFFVSFIVFVKDIFDICLTFILSFHYTCYHQIVNKSILGWNMVSSYGGFWIIGIYRSFKTSNTSCLPKRHRQTVQTQIRLLLKKQSDQGLPCLLLWQAFCEFQPWKPTFYSSTEREKWLKF